MRILDFSYYKSTLLIGAFLFLSCYTQSKINTISNHSLSTYDTHTDQQDFPNPLSKIIFNRQKNNKIAAALAFPFPFGFVGLHRVYLGTAPHVPIVYAATAGGIFGLLPLIDCIILLSNKKNVYENNQRVIMWINQNNKKNISTSNKEL